MQELKVNEWVLLLLGIIKIEANAKWKELIKLGWGRFNLGKIIERAKRAEFTK